LPLLEWSEPLFMRIEILFPEPLKTGNKVGYILHFLSWLVFAETR
jgi:hypothetical protein